jgi:hypothetical protein
MASRRDFESLRPKAIENIFNSARLCANRYARWGEKGDRARSPLRHRRLPETIKPARTGYPSYLIHFSPAQGKSCLRREVAGHSPSRTLDEVTNNDSVRRIASGN